MKTPGFPIKFSKTPSVVERGAPLVGEHTREILGETGRDPTEIEALIAAGVVRAG
ncbi:formyl-coenzyme A transferase [compost metagenome]